MTGITYYLMHFLYIIQLYIHQTYKSVYGKLFEIPVKLKSEPKPRYNYDNEFNNLKQKSGKTAKEKLIESQSKIKEGCRNLKEYSIDLHVIDLILLKDNTLKTKLHSLWLGPFEVLEILNNEKIVIKKRRCSVNIHKDIVKNILTTK